MRLAKSIKANFSGRALYILLFLLIITTSAVAQDEDFNLFSLSFGWNEWSDRKNMLYHHLAKQAYAFLDIRDQEISRLITQEDWLRRQEKVKEILMELVGPFPKKTPLNARITGKIQKEGYHIENIIFESVPNFYVTSTLFVPDGVTGKRPAILYVCGHYDNTFKTTEWQLFIINLVKKGFIVFAIEPLDQGERLEYYDPEKRANIIGPSWVEHSYVGNQYYISGINLARYFIWDGIRAIDYLLTRNEVDPERLGITGISGGGTQTAYIAAFDERIKAAAPACYINGFRRLLESIGPSDAEQNFYREISSGITHADFIELMAPKPYLIVSTTRDWFVIQGARETFREAKKAYKALGKEDNLVMSEDDYTHGYTLKNKEAIYAFFQKAFEFPGSSIEEDAEFLTFKELTITPTGQLSTSLRGETSFSLNKKESEKLLEKLEASRKNIAEHLGQVQLKAKELSGYVAPGMEGEPVFRGRYRRVGYSIEMFVLQGEEKGYVIPLLVFVPDGGGKFPAVVYLHPKGKTAAASPGADIEKLVRRGYIVAAPDLIGTGETDDKSAGADFIGVMIGRSRVGIQAGDIVRVVNLLKERSDVRSADIGAVAFEEMCPALLHAAVFDQSINGIAVVDAPVSYRSIVQSRFYEFNFSCAVAGALTAYDLPDLAGCLAPRKLLLMELKEAGKQTASSELVKKEFAFPQTVYGLKNVPGNIKVIYNKPVDYIYSIVDWLFK